MKKRRQQCYQVISKQILWTVHNLWLVFSGYKREKVRIFFAISNLCKLYYYLNHDFIMIWILARSLNMPWQRLTRSISNRKRSADEWWGLINREIRNLKIDENDIAFATYNLHRLLTETSISDLMLFWCQIFVEIQLSDLISDLRSQISNNI